MLRAGNVRTAPSSSPCTPFPPFRTLTGAGQDPGGGSARSSARRPGLRRLGETPSSWGGRARRCRWRRVGSGGLTTWSGGRSTRWASSAPRRLGGGRGRRAPAAAAAGVARPPDLLGGNGLLLGPIFTSAPTATTRSTTSQIDPRLGDDDDFDALVAACRERGSGCCSTVSSTMPAGTSRRSPRHWPRTRDRRPRIGCPRCYDTDGVISADYFEGHDTLVTLNHDSPRSGVRRAT